MRSLGIGIMYWASRWTDPQPPMFAKAKEAGFDVVEISLINGGDINIKTFRDELDRQGLGVNCIMGLTPETDISSQDPAIQRAGIEYVKHALDATAQLGSPVLCGLPYLQWLFFPEGDELQLYRERCAKALQEIAITASDCGITICLEVINRFETFMFNTVTEASSFLQQIGHASIKLHLDTYHMNMEEDDIASAIREAGTQLGHFHCVASNRKLPGQGHIKWQAIRSALDDIGYEGGLGIEAFPLPDTETGRTVNTWRPLVNDLDTDIRQAASFVRRHLIDG